MKIKAQKAVYAKDVKGARFVTEAGKTYESGKDIDKQSAIDLCSRGLAQAVKEVKKTEKASK